MPLKEETNNNTGEINDPLYFIWPLLNLYKLLKYSTPRTYDVVYNKNSFLDMNK